MIVNGNYGISTSNSTSSSTGNFNSAIYTYEKGSNGIYELNEEPLSKEEMLEQWLRNRVEEICDLAIL